MDADRANDQASNGAGGLDRRSSGADDDMYGPNGSPDHTEPNWHPSAEWLAGEDRADDDIRTGRVQQFESVEELLADLHATSTESKRGAD